jgi:hypothetical protein
MKTIRIIFATLLAIYATAGLAQQDVSGTWAGNLAVGPDTSLQILFVLTRQPDGSYSAVVTSTDPGGIKDMPATSVSFDGNQLDLAVEALSGSYEGTFADGTFSGNWSQPGGSIPLTLAPYVAPTLTDADKDLLRGSWVGKLETPIGNYTMVFRFEDDADGEFTGFLDSPDEGARGIPITNIELTDGKLEFRVPRAVLTYTATMADGKMTDGTWSQRGQDVPLSMEKGEYVPAGIQLSDEAFSRLEGSWVGKLTNPAGNQLNVVFRFEKNDEGNIAAFMDSPDQGAKGIPVTEASLDGDQLSMTIPAARGSYTATVTDGQIEGTWSQGPNQQPLVLTPGEYTPTVAVLDLTDEAMAALEGTWRGQMGPLEIVMRFERTADGQPVAFLDVPMQGVTGVSIDGVSLTDGDLSVSIAAISTNYTGKLDGSQITGQWAQGPNNNPLVLTKD